MVVDDADVTPVRCPTCNRVLAHKKTESFLLEVIKILAEIGELDSIAESVGIDPGPVYEQLRIDALNSTDDQETS